jgi:hypothetical protein
MMNRSCIVLVAALFAALAPSTRAQVPSDADLNVRLFLKSVYPNLFQRSVTLVWHTDGTHRRVTVMDGSVNPLTTNTSTRLMDADFELDSAHTVRRFSARGVYLNEEQNRRLASAMKTAVGFDAAVVTVGRTAAFGPARPPDPPKQIDVSAGSAQPLRVIASAPATSVDQDFGFRWSVTAEVGNRGRTYVLTFEPFDGRLVSMVER